MHSPKLELFGYGAKIHPLGRDPTTGAVVLHERWVYPKMYFRTADDYGNEDWEWLLRYHGYDDDDHCEFYPVNTSPVRANAACSHAQYRDIPLSHAAKRGGTSHHLRA